MGIRSIVLAALGAALLATGAEANEVVVYSARSHYGQEPAIDAFTKKTGIQVKSFGGNSSELIKAARPWAYSRTCPAAGSAWTPVAVSCAEHFSIAFTANPTASRTDSWLCPPITPPLSPQ